MKTQNTNPATFVKDGYAHMASCPNPDGCLGCSTDAPVFWQVLEFTKNGAESRYLGQDFQHARDLYESFEHSYFVELHGRGEDGRPIPGVMGENIPLGRRAYGQEV